MHKLAVKILTASLPLIALSACAEKPETFSDPTPGYYQNAVNASVNNVLEQQSQIATSSLQTLAMIKRTRTPPTIDPTPDSQVPPEFRTHVTEINWVGPADGVVRDLAEKAGYTFIPSRISQSEAPSVNLTLRDESIAKALDTIGLQIQDRAKIIVDPEEHTITIRPLGESAPTPIKVSTSEGRRVRHVPPHHRRPSVGKDVAGHS